MKKKRKRRRKIIGFLILIFLALIILGGIWFLYNILKPSEENFLKAVDYNNYASINYYDIYGIHMNFKGTFSNPDKANNLKLVLTDGTNEIDIPWELEENYNSYNFTTSKYINEGINLEKLNKGNYYLLIKGTINDENNEEKNIYYPLKNETEYSDLEYYTLTKNGKNNKIDIKWDEYDNHQILNFNIKETKLPKDVYDITIDPGHDANDSGKLACSDGSPTTNSGLCKTGTLYKESDMNLYLSQELKKQLEELGYKVTMTRNSESDTVPTYGKMGSATMANDTKSKLNLAIHHNSSGISGGSSSLKGLELYVANDINFDFAELLVENITKYANTKTSPKTLDLVEDGIYQRFFTEEEIAQDDERPENKTTDTIYYYFIREVGGIATHAYNDGRYSNYDKNEHYNSNNTAASYLFEMGYLDNVADLKNIINNREGYAKGIAQAIKQYLNE